MSASSNKRPRPPSASHPAPKKHKPTPASAPSTRLPIDPPPPPTPEAILTHHFHLFTTSLSALLSPSLASALPTLGPAATNLLLALRTMHSTGELPFLPAPPPTLPPPPPPPPAATPYPPPLPPIHSTPLREQAFTHRSFIPGQHASLPGVEHTHYERLEYLGDAHLEALTSHILYTRFPTLREGRLSYMRQQLVSNETLRQHARRYNMHLCVREGKNNGITAAESRGREKGRKSVADVFEAYLGALVVERGLAEGMSVAEAWLRGLYEPQLRRWEEEEEAGEGAEGVAGRRAGRVDKMAKQGLHALCGGYGARLEYRMVEEPGSGGGDGYGFAVFLTGWGWAEKEVGRGWGSNKGDASLRAAMDALGREEWVREVEGRKRRWLEGLKKEEMGKAAMRKLEEVESEEGEICEEGEA